MPKSKVLFISHDPFSELGSNGKTYLSLFKEFDKDQVAQLFFNDLQPRSSKFETFFRLRAIDILKSFFLGKTIKGEVDTNSDGSVIKLYGKRTFLKTELIKLFRNFCFTFFKLSKEKTLENWLDTNRPEVILFLGSNYLYQYKIVKQLSEKFNIPYYIYFADDYLIYNNGNNLITKYLHKRFLNRVSPIINNARELFVIGPTMRTEYTAHYRKECTVLINSINKDKMPAPKNNLDDAKLLTFRYLGWLHNNRSESLGYLGKCLQHINEKYKKNCLLEIYTLSELSSKDTEDLSINSIKICPAVSQDYVIETMENSDFLVHAESYLMEYNKVMMLSVSTKVPEYLLSNRCIIAVGSHKLSSISIMKEANLSVVLSEEKNIEEDSLLILNVINDPQLYNGYCQRAINYCREEFDSKKMQEALKSKLLQE